MALVEEECSLCEVAYPYRSLYRCDRCKKLYCRNCFIFDEEGKVICLRCATRRIAPKTSRSKYAPLSIYLARKARYTNRATLTFATVEDIIGEHLPPSAKSNVHWWGNVRNRSPSEAWMTVGWSVQNVDLEKKEVTFKKDESNPVQPVQTRRRQRRKPVSPSFKALATKRRTRIPKGPSKTKIAIAQARLRNIGYRKDVKRYRGKLKPKRAYEKRLYDAEAKPDEDS